MKCDCCSGFESFSSLQKMSEWVAVCADEAEEPVEIPTEADGELLSWLSCQTFLLAKQFCAD